MTDLIKVPDKVLDEIKGGSDGMLVAVKKLEIDSETKAEKSAEVLKDIKVQLNNAEALRKSFTQPLNESLKNINNAFKKATESFTEAEGILKKKLLDWKRAENERIAREEARRQKIQMSHYNQGHDVNPLVQLDRVKRVGDTSTKKVWKWEVTNFQKLSDEYKVVNNVALNQAIRDGKREIAGVKIYQEDTLSVSTKLKE